MKTFLGMEAEQTGNVIELYLDNYIQEVLSTWIISSYNQECTSSGFSAQ